METKAEMSCMAEMGKIWSELKGLAQDRYEGLSVPMLHRELGDAHDMGQLQCSVYFTQYFLLRALTYATAPLGSKTELLVFIL